VNAQPSKRIAITRGCYASRIWVTPRCNWAIGLKSGKGIGVGMIWRIIIATIIILDHGVGCLICWRHRCAPW
jgi:hypothetical protein